MSAQKKDNNGFITIEKNPISRAGVFQYLGKSIGADEPNKIYNVYRPPEELMDAECLDSFKLLPIVDDHTMVGEGFTPAEKKGVHGSTGEDVLFENNTLFSNLRIFSETVKKLIQSGKKHLSLGYRCAYEKASGSFEGQAYDYIQRKLRGNHLALVDQSRCDVLVLDQNVAMDYSDINIKDLNSTDEMEHKMADEPMNEPVKDAAPEAMTLEKVAEMVTALAEKVAKMEGAEKAEAADITKDEPADVPPTAEAEKVIAPAEKAQGMDAAEIKKIQDGATKAAIIEVAQRDKLAKNLSQFIGTFDHAEKTLAEVAKYGVDKLGIKCPAGSELIALDGYFVNRPNPASLKTVSMDSKPAAKEGSSVVKYLKGIK